MCAEQTRRSPIAALCVRVTSRLPRQAMVASGGLVASSGVFQASIFLATIVIARAVGQAELGRYAVANAIGSIVVSGLGGGIPILAIREIAAHGLSQAFLKKVIQAEFLVTSAGTVVASLIGWLVMGGVRGLALGALAGAANITLSQLSLIGAVHAGMQRYRAMAAGRAVCGALLIVLTIAALAVGLGIAGALGGLAVAGGVSSAWLYRSARKRLSAEAGPDCTRLFARSCPLIGIGLIYGGYQRIDLLVVLAVTTASTAGIYAAAYRMLSPFTLMAAGFGTVFLSRLSSMGIDDRRWHAVRNRGRRLFAICLLPAIGVAFLTMPYLISLFYGATFASAVGPARVLLLSLIPYVLYIPNAHALNAVGRERSLLVVLATSMAAEVALMVGLSRTLGASGAAWAWLITECLTLGGVAWIMRKLSLETAPAVEPDAPTQLFITREQAT